MLRDTARQLLVKECPSTLLRAGLGRSGRGHPALDHAPGRLGRARAGGPRRSRRSSWRSTGAPWCPGCSSRRCSPPSSSPRWGWSPSAGSASVAIAAVDGPWVPHGSPIKHHVVEADAGRPAARRDRQPRRPLVSLVDPAVLPRREVEQFDQLRREFEVDVGGLDAGEPVDPDALRRGVERALVALSAELIGVGRWLLDTSVDYAKERIQFDVPIGSFQGLQWMLVDAALDLERAAGAVAYAAMCVDADDDDRHRAVHGAKAEAGLAARHCAADGHAGARRDRVHLRARPPPAPAPRLRGRRAHGAVGVAPRSAGRPHLLSGSSEHDRRERKNG